MVGDEPVRVLLVDDNQVVRDAVAGVLESQGFQVVQVPSAIEAMQFLFADPANSIDLLLSDVNMPLMSGLQLAEWTRSIYPDLKVILMSGGSPLDAKRLGRNTRFLQKPFTPSELLDLLNEIP